MLDLFWVTWLIAWDEVIPFWCVLWAPWAGMVTVDLGKLQRGSQDLVPL